MIRRSVTSDYVFITKLAHIFLLLTSGAGIACIYFEYIILGQHFLINDIRELQLTTARSRKLNCSYALCEKLVAVN